MATRTSRVGGRKGLAVDLRVLVIAPTEETPTSRAWLAELAAVGVPHDVFRPGRNPLRPADLLRGPGHGRYNAVVLTNDTSTYWSSLPDLADYRREFGVRQVCGFEFPRAAYGVVEVEGQQIGPEQASLTPEGHAGLPYLTGTVPIPAGTYGYPTSTLDRDSFTPWLRSAEGGVLAGVHAADGLETFLLAVNYDQHMVHWRLLSRGLLAWVTQGCHLGMSRSYLACHVDDVLLPNSLAPDWCSADEVARAQTVRMTPADVDAVIAWQHRHVFTLDLAFNGYGARAGDPLTASLLENQAEFRWLNHTWSHLHLGMVPREGGSPRWQDVTTLCTEIEKNLVWAQEVGLSPSPTALVTGGHSGLDNPYLPEALERTGITAIATDASRGDPRTTVGSAAAVSRHPTNVFAHTTTWEGLIDSYNRVYDGVVAPVETPADFLDRENAICLRHMLSNDPSPVFAHQSNLVGDRLILRLLEHALDLYYSLVAETAPLLNLSMDDVAAELLRRSSWAEALQRGDVESWVSNGEVVIASTSEVHFPLTVPAGTYVRRGWARREAFGEPYAGTRSGWQHAEAGTSLSLSLTGGAVAEQWSR